MSQPFPCSKQQNEGEERGAVLALWYFHLPLIYQELVKRLLSSYKGKETKYIIWWYLFIPLLNYISKEEGKKKLGVYSTYRWSYLQNRNRGTDIDSKHMDTRAGKRGQDELGDWHGHTYTTDTICKIDNKNLLYSTGDSTQCSAVPYCMVLSRFRCIRLCDLMDCGLSCSSVHGILQARILEWVAISSSRGSSRLRDWTQVPWVSRIVGGFFTAEPPGMPTQRSAKSLQSCPTLYDPRDGSPPGSLSPGILQARTLKWAAISFSNAWKWSRSVMSDSQRPHGLQPTRHLRPWDFPGKSTGAGCHCFLHSALCGDLNGKEIQSKGDICICVADSLYCTADTNATL